MSYFIFSCFPFLSYDIIFLIFFYFPFCSLSFSSLYSSHSVLSIFFCFPFPFIPSFVKLYFPCISIFLSPLLYSLFVLLFSLVPLSFYTLIFLLLFYFIPPASSLSLPIIMYFAPSFIFLSVSFLDFKIKVLYQIVVLFPHLLLYSALFNPLVSYFSNFTFIQLI